MFSYIVSCALPEGESLTVEDSTGTQYTFDGQIGLAPAWAKTTPTVAERHWVTACLLARTNYYGVPVALSMRGSHPALDSSPGEEAEFSQLEGAFYGDLFDPEVQSWHACGSSQWTVELAETARRLCAISEDGVTTKCEFTYTHLCDASDDEGNDPACTGEAPFSSCNGSDAVWPEVISIFLRG